MTEENDVSRKDMQERRIRRGTWPWFIMNFVLFPAPAHFTLLRVREFTFGRSLAHLGATFLLVLVLLASAGLQLAFPAFGRLWMLFPVLSGLVLLYLNRSLKVDFKPFDIALDYRSTLFLMVLVLVLTLISVLPTFEFIELNKKPTGFFRSWFCELPFWQETIILVLGLLLLLVGYATNSTAPFSINRAIILYTCFVVFVNQIFFALMTLFGWLKIQGGFWSQCAAVLLAAVLALDYWDARTFGQYVRRYFFLTCTKGVSIIFLWVCLFGLPQKAASGFASYHYKRSKPVVGQILHRHLVFSERDRFISAHEAARRLRALYAKAFLTSRYKELARTARLVEEGKGSIFPADTDICRFTDLICSRDIQSSSMAFDRIPFFRPVHPDWDVMLTALLFQGTISKPDLDRIIADFKTTLPKTSLGHLPAIDTPYKACYASLATGTSVDFLPPRFEILEALLQSGFCPVISLRLAGKNYWAVLLHRDPESGTCWFRIENLRDMEKSVQLLFDSGEAGPLRHEILSRYLVPMSAEYLRGVIKHYSGPVVVFSREGIGKALPEPFTGKDLEHLKRAVAQASSPFQPAAPIMDNKRENPFSEYSDYIRTIAAVKAMLEPSSYDQDLFPRPAAETFGRRGPSRLDEIDALLERVGPLRDCDRVDIAFLLANNNHVYGAPDLFVRLAAKAPFSTDLVDCRVSLVIGRQLFLLEYHREASGYLKLAFQRHPFNPEYELWHQIARIKMQMPPTPLYSPPHHQLELKLYYQTLTDIRKGDEKSALKRLEKEIEKDTHNSLANHLRSKYFKKPLDERYFFQAPEGL